MSEKIAEYFGDPLSTYTSEQATEDGILLETKILPFKPKQGIISHITTNLLSKGYWKEDKTLNLPNILDLLNQAVQIIKRKKKPDWFYSGEIELPSGAKQKIFVVQNETQKFTAMLPEDY